MNTINILIVEDEPLIAKDLSFMLEDLDYKIAGIAYNGEDALEIVRLNSVDLAILDISIEGKMNGIELASKLGDIPFIYLTSHASKEIVERAKKTEPLAYLVKPIDEHDLLSTIDIAFYNFQKSKIINRSKELFIKSGSTYVKVGVNDILYVEANDNYCFIHCKQKKFLISQTLKVIEQRLSEYNFLRIHRSFLINYEHIEKFSEVHVTINGVELPISRKHKLEFKSKLNLL